jgi:hypothetical protein
MPKVTTQVGSASVITTAGNTASAAVQPVGNVGGPVVVHIGVDVVSGTASPTWAPVVQFSMDGTTWLAAGADETIPPITTTGVTVWRVAQSRGMFVRVSWPLPGGTNPSFTATIAIWS